MASLQADDILDLVKGTLKDLGRMSFQQIAQDIQDYEVLPKWFKKDKVYVESGYNIQRSLMTTFTATRARHVGLMDVDVTNITDVMQQMSIPWRHATTTWSYVYEEMLMNKGQARVFNIIKPRRADAMISLAEELENKAWSSPSSSSDNLEPYGIPYWIVKNSATGFNGGVASGHTTVGGIDPATHTKFKNYTVGYTVVSKADLIKKVRTMLRKTGWKSPVGINDYRNGKADRYRLYVNDTTIESLIDVGESQNENLGRDLASIEGGDLLFQKHPIRWVPKLDADTSNPVYVIDHSTFMPVILKGNYLRETGPLRNSDNKDVYDTHTDISYNYLDFDRRRSGVAYIV